MLLAPGPIPPPAASPVADLGTISLLIALVIAAWCIGAGIAGNARQNRRLVLSAVYGLYAFFALIGLASALIIYAFVTHDYSIKYVAATSDTSMSLAYKITSFWGALEGSLLFWVLVLSGFATVAIKVNQHRHRDMMGYVVATIMVVQLFFLALLIFAQNPFDTFMTPAPQDGEGLNPLLQNYWMVIHPPSLYIGYIAATIPFAFGIGALASGRLDDLWLSSVRTWTMICFFFLSFGLILGGRWAYEELGWGGYWAWDPVENAGLFPWFTATAFLHSAIIQEQRGMMKAWNLMLVILTFLLTIFGTFMTRSGVVQSVHAFGKDDQLALLFVLFMLVIAVVSFGLLIYRAPKLRSSNSFESFTSREFAFLLNNWILLGCAFFVLFATMFPTISEGFAGKRISVGIPFFDKFMVPLGLLLLLLAGIAPLMAWRRTTRERMTKMFAFPTAAMTLTVALLAFFAPRTRVLTSVFHAKLELPMQLVCFGFVAFVIASIMQEYWQGLRVRMKQTGSDPITSLVGMVLVKRRKYGGYIIHLGVAVMFIGFAGKAWDTKQFREVEMPLATVLAKKQADSKDASLTRAALTAEEREVATFHVRRYTFVYEKLIEENDDAKHATTATLRLSVDDGVLRHVITALWEKTHTGLQWRNLEELGVMEPAKWDFHKSDQPTTEVAIHPRLAEDVYIVLDHYDPETRKAVFVIFVNPLINWVWFGFVLLGLGTFVCLIPQSLVDRVAARPRTRMGRAADAAILILAIGGATFVSVQAARAEVGPQGDNVVVAAATGDEQTAGGGGPPAGMEHEDGQAASMGHGDGFAHTFRPESLDNPDGRGLAARLMKELVCLCGGCQRENLFDCKCGYAAQEREIVLALLDGKDLSTGGARSAAYDEVVGTFMRRYGGEQVLATPRNQLSWILPYVAILGGLGLLIVAGRRWVVRGRAQAATADAAVKTEDDLYAEKLDDELRDID